MRFPAVSVASAALLILLCGPPAARAATPKACDLLGSQMASTILGTPVGPATDSGNFCFYTSKSENANVGLVTVEGQERMPILSKNWPSRGTLRNQSQVSAMRIYLSEKAPMLTV
jgi:hypothetical protein